jgi:hypothetical protein
MDQILLFNISLHIRLYGLKQITYQPLEDDLLMKIINALTKMIVFFSKVDRSKMSSVSAPIKTSNEKLLSS